MGLPAAAPPLPRIEAPQGESVLPKMAEAVVLPAFSKPREPPARLPYSSSFRSYTAS